MATAGGLLKNCSDGYKQANKQKQFNISPYCAFRIKADII
jgi:hypothetical protein